MLSGPNRRIADDFSGVDSPKLKFNFTMSLEYTGMAANIGDDDPYQITLAIKQITRPAPNVIYEDVNFYNFMTKVATKVDFGVITATLYDDSNNNAHDIFRYYMETISPITRQTREFAVDLDRHGQFGSGSLGRLPNNASRNGPIKSIRVNHITNNRGRMVVYDFLNPKIQNVTLDELDMTQSDVSTITFTFIYDSYHTDTVYGANAGKVSPTSSTRPRPNLLGDVYVPAFRKEESNSSKLIYTDDGFPRLPGAVSIPGIPGLNEIAGRYGTGAVPGFLTQDLPNVPEISNALRNQRNVDGIPPQVLSNVLKRLTG